MCLSRLHPIAWPISLFPACIGQLSLLGAANLNDNSNKTLSVTLRFHGFNDIDYCILGLLRVLSHYRKKNWPRFQIQVF
ncbi:hypothetical protein BC827DRAFT_261715 [Russula dissimulans]|nr:hypothetical protein BC827DRAFT_261715 [Russula dissimulans]